MFRFLVSILCCLSIACVELSAQTDTPLRNKEPGGILKEPHGKPFGGMIDRNPSQMNYKAYEDEGVEDLAKAIEDRDWGSESTAWERASGINTRDSYQKYAAMYPYGAHAAEANKRLIDLKVNDMFTGSHNSFPKIERTAADDESPVSTITIYNHTDYFLTVMFSGERSISATIMPGSFETLTVQNGSYVVGASVPPAGIRPFAGEATFRGGKYETGFIILRTF